MAEIATEMLASNVPESSKQRSVMPKPKSKFAAAFAKKFGDKDADDKKGGKDAPKSGEKKKLPPRRKK